jgi:hypothetical protein
MLPSGRLFVFNGAFQHKGAKTQRFEEELSLLFLIDPALLVGLFCLARQKRPTKKVKYHIEAIDFDLALRFTLYV